MNKYTTSKLTKCEICPRKCGVNRHEGFKGYCKCDDKIKIALVSTHYYEEPCISGTEGSGTIFFSNCNLSCVYCQNHEISQDGKGREVSIERLAEIMLEQQSRGVNNINLVTPQMYMYQIIEAIKISRQNGLTIPIVYNTSSYENVENLRDLEGYVDVYLPDLKYFYDDIAIKYSNAPNYFEIATKAIMEMYRQVGRSKLDNRGMMKSGMIIRHLILPGHIQNSIEILKWIRETLPKDTYISIMAQYFPTYLAKTNSKYNEINRKISKEEYKMIEDYVYELGIENGFMQDLGEHEEEFVPKFDFRNI